MGWARYVAAGLGALTTLTACGSGSGPATPTKSSEARLTIAVAPQGSATMAELRRDYRVVGARLRSLNLGSARLLGNHILITAPTKDLAQAQSIATDPGNLRFRQVLALHPSASATANPAVNRAVSVTPALMTSLAHWDCQTNPNPTGGTDSAKNYMLACNVKRSRVYLLAPASLDGSDVQAASAGLDYQPTLPEGSEAPTPGEVLDVPNGTPWVVNLKFTRSGAARWLALTEKTYEVSNGPASGYPDCVPPKGCNAVGITLDGIVESDPATEVDGIPGGLTVISGNFSQAEADRLAAVLRGGSLPVPLHVVG